MAMSGAALFLAVLIIIVLWFLFAGKCHKHDDHFRYQDSNTKRRNRTIDNPQLSQDCDGNVTLEWDGNPQLTYFFLIGHRHAPLRSGYNVTSEDGHFEVHLKKTDLSPLETDKGVQVEIWSDAHDDFHQYLPVMRD